MSLIICSTSLASGLNLTQQLKGEHVKLHYFQKPQLQILIMEDKLYFLTDLALFLIFSILSSNIFLSPPPF